MTPVMVDGTPVKTTPGANHSVTVNDLGAIGSGQQKLVTMKLLFGGLPAKMQVVVSTVLSFTSSPAIPSQYSTYTITSSLSNGSPDVACDMPPLKYEGGCACQLTPSSQRVDFSWGVLAALWAGLFFSLRSLRRLLFCRKL
jgi:hypothetical protein